MTTAKQVVLATGNKGKVKELQVMLAENANTANWQILPQSNWSFEEAEETGSTFIENAIIKARHACKKTGLPAIADDSGLAVDALNGAPGVYSARYAGSGASDSDNINKLLRELSETPVDKRGAQFHCVLVYMKSATDPTPLICHGMWHGSILTEPQGSQGFGYDPVFWVTEHECSAAELAPSMKQKLSHRGKALTQLLGQIS